MVANLKPRKHIPVAGQRFQKLTVIQRVADDPKTKSANLKVRVRVECECGTRLTIPYYYITRTQPQPKASCGQCGEKSLMAQHPTTHTCWYMMNYRCTKPDHINYKSYGGRGITVCPEWSWDNPDGFKNFLEYMGPRPSMKLSIDRVDVNGNYQPFQEDGVTRQVRWATAKEQRANQRPRS